MLTDFAQQTAVVVFPAQRLYMDIGASKVGFANPMVWQLFRPDSVEDACGGWLRIAAEHRTQMTCKKIGAEAINGRSTTKYQIGGTESGFLWVDQQLRILLKMEAGSTHLELQNVREGLQSPNLFEIPAAIAQWTWRSNKHWRNEIHILTRLGVAIIMRRAACMLVSRAMRC